MLAEQFVDHDVEVSEPIRIAAHPVKWGIKSDEGDGDAWPKIREQIIAADILIFGTPIWMGQPSSVAKLEMERMDAFLDETDEAGRMPSYSKVAVAAIVGNEDGATMFARRFSKRSTMSAGRSPLFEAATGLAKRWGRPTSRISNIARE